MKTDGLKFETALKTLEEIVRKMEGGELPLDETLQSFEDGIMLAKFCEQKLSEAEGKVDLLLKDGAATKLTPFSDPSDSETQDSL